jgi:hypothetical protein
VDLFRALNLSQLSDSAVSPFIAALSVLFWLALPLAAGLWKFHRTDL